MKLTIEILKRAKTQIISFFYKNGGKEEFLKEYMLSLKEGVELGLADDFSSLKSYCQKFLSKRVKGIVEKRKIADIIGESDELFMERKGIREMKYNFFKKGYDYEYE